MCAYKIMLFSGKKNMRLHVYSVCADILICAYFLSFTVIKKYAGLFIIILFISLFIQGHLRFFDVIFFST